MNAIINLPTPKKGKAQRGGGNCHFNGILNPTNKICEIIYPVLTWLKGLVMDYYNSLLLQDCFQFYHTGCQTPQKKALLYY